MYIIKPSMDELLRQHYIQKVPSAVRIEVLKYVISLYHRILPNLYQY